MAWIPRYKSSGLCSPLIPNGDLSGLIRLCGQYGNLFDVPSGISGNYSSGQDDQGGLHTWDGAFGFNVYNALIGKLKTEARAGGAAHSNITIAEVEVKKPTGAQYYKQTIAVVGYYDIGAEQTSHGYHGDDAFVLKWAGGNFSVLKVVRREYSTPYSQYTSTDLIVQTLGQNFSIVTQGYNEYWIENRENFLTKMYFSMSFATYNNVKYFCWAIYSELQNQYDYSEPKKKNCSGMISGLTETHLDTVYGDFEPDEQEDPNDAPEEPGGPGDEPEEPGGGGGEGDHILPDEDIDVPPLPDFGAGSVRWLTVYEMDQADVSEFGEELIQPTPWERLKQFFNDPLDSIVTLSLCPVKAPIHGQKTPVVPGLVPYTFERSFDYISNEFCVFDCGEVRIEPYWDSFLDFQPYTRMQLFLPFIGFIDLQVDEIMGATLGVKYHINVVTGDCIAYVLSSGDTDSFYGAKHRHVMSQHAGNCGMRVPIGRVSYDAEIGNSFQLLAMGLGMGVSAAMVAEGLVDSSDINSSQVANQVSSGTMTFVNGQKTSIKRSGAISGSAGYMGSVTPYIVRIIPRQRIPDNYKELKGYPCNKGNSLRDFSGTGYAAVEDIQLNNIAAMEDERAEIMDWLRKGVLI